MPLTAGQKLGPYEIVAPLGAGGMGEVYRARDTRLGRDVAIKVLPPGMADDPERRARFEREARAVAALNHPHICVIHDVGRAPGEAGSGETDYLVMELVEGETLADRVKRGPLPVADTLRIGAEIAEALDRAHRAGIVHRDLKPANVMLSKSGTKLMDFGLARAAGAAAGGSSGSQLATMSRPVTAEGHIVGTFQYMAPEQLEGREADARADVWALGATLYEMATGTRPFEGESTASLIGAIMRAEPQPLAERAPASPASLERVIRICLAKDPDQRWQSAGDIARMLRGLDGTASGSGTAVAVAPRRRSARESIAWTLAVLLPLAAFAAARFAGGPHDTADTLRSALTLPPGAVYHFSGDFAGPPAISPDGRRIAFVALDDQHGASIWVRELDRLDAQPVPGTTGGSFPFWSPDGRSLGFQANLQLKRVDLDGGAVVTLAEAGGLRGAAWGRDGSIVYSPEAQGGLVRIPAAGGTPVTITVPDTATETTHRFPQILPGGRNILYFAANHRDPTSKQSSVWVTSIDGKTRRKLLQASCNAVYADGHLLYLQDSVLFARPFDPRLLRFTGDAVPTRERIQPDLSTWTSNLSASETGRLAYVLLGPTFGSRIEERDREGKRLRVLTSSANHTSVVLSRDGRTLAQGSQESAAADIWSIDLVTGRRTLAIGGKADQDAPVLSPRGDRLLFSSNDAGRPYRLMIGRSDGAGEMHEVLRGTRDLIGSDWSRDGRFALVFAGDILSGIWDTLMVVNPEDGRSRQVVVVSPGSFGDARLSPDGRWLAYTEGTYGQTHIIVIPFVPAWPAGKAPTGRWQAGTSGGAYPRWPMSGREIVFARLDGTVVSVEVDPAPEGLRIGGERELFRAALRPQTPGMEVSPDGQRFYVNVLSGDDVSRLALVTNWTAGLAKK
jgi:eukaryotic-like serine/threonine-protein kinase